MKVNTPNPSQKARIVPPIPLERVENPPLEKGEYLTYKLRNNPTDDSSPLYELSVPFFGTGTPEQWLKFMENLSRVCAGQNVTNGPGKFAVARRLLKSDALAAFNEAVEGQNETLASFDEAIAAVTRYVFPKRAAQLQKRYLRRVVRKPVDMSTKQFAARINELNSYLPKFPPATIGGPPAAKLDEDEIVHLMEFGIPRSWQQKMITFNHSCRLPRA